MATNNTYINAQDDFIVKGNLTVEGNVTQVSTTINENRVAAEEFIINSDGENTTAKITFNSNNTFANISYLTGGNLVVEPNLQGNIIIGAGQTLTVASGASISGNVFTGSLAGVADEAKMFTNSVEVTLAGDATSTGGQFQGAGNVATLQTTLASVNSNPGSYGDATTVPVITVDAKGRITAASEIAVSVTASQVSDFTSAARAVNSGSLGVNYNSTTGAISLTQFGGAGQYGSATAVPQIVVDNGGRISSSSNVNIQLPKSQVTNFDSEVRTLIQLTDAGGDGSLTYNSGSGTFVFTGVAPSETRAHFSAVNVSGDGSLAYNNGTGAFSYTGPSAAETRAHFSGGSGIDINSGVITPDSTVVRTSGNQTIAGNKTLSGDTVFTGEVDLTGATIPGTVTFSGNIVATNIDTVTQTDSIITDNNIYLNQGGSDRDAKIHVQHTGANVYLKWDEGTDRWQFSNNGSTDNDLLLKTDFSASSGINYNSSTGAFTADTTEIRGLFTGGSGLTYSAGTFNIGAGSGITVNADDIEANVSYIRELISVADGGGDGTLSYSNSTGVISYAGPSASELLSHFTSSSGLTISSAISSISANVSYGPTYASDYSGSGWSHSANYYSPSDTPPKKLILSSNTPVAVELDNVFSETANIRSNVDTITVSNASVNKADITADLYFAASVDSLSAGHYVEANILVNGATVRSQKVQIRDHGSLATNIWADESHAPGSIYNLKVEAIGLSVNTNDTIQIQVEKVQGSDSIGSYYHAHIRQYAYGGSNQVFSKVNTILYNGDIDFTPDSTVIRTTGDQSLAGAKTFTGKLVVPTTATTEANALYSDGNEAYIYINGVAKQITPTASVGSVEDVGTGEIDIYAGSRVASNVTYHGIKSLSSGTYTSVSENANVVTVEGDITAIRGAFSAVDNAGDGTFTYNSSTGAFSYSGISTAQVRTNFSASGSISYDSGTGVFTSSADNYSNWQLNTDSGSANAITSGEIVTFSGGTGINVSNNGNTVTIASTNTADITAVTAGTGLTGGGTSGAVTLTANASYIRTLFNGGGDIAYDPNTGTISFTNDAGDITAVTAGTNLTGGGTTGAVTLNLDTSSDIDMNGNKVLFGNMYGTEGALPSASTYHGMFAHVHGTGKGYFAHGGNWIKLLDETSSDTDDLTEGSSNLYHTTARVRAAISATAPLSYNSSTGVISLTEVGDITQVNITAGTGLSGSVNTTTGAHTQTIDLMEATSSALGGIKVGYTENSQNYPVELSSGKAFVSVPWVDTNTNTTYSAGTGLSLNGTQFNVGDLTVDELAPAFIIKSTESFANNDTTIMTSAAIEDKILSYGYTTDVGDITGVTAGTGLSGGGSSGSVTLNVSGLTVSELAGSTLQTSGESFADNDTSLMTSAAIQDKITSYGYTTTVGDITAVVAGNGLSGGASSGSATLNVDLTDTAVFTSTNTASKAVVRDGSGNFAAGTISATATQAQYADLAENYVADADYEPGTVLILGGEHEVTTTDEAGSYKAVGVVSTDPAHLMNSTCEGEHVVAVALRGRVPCKVIGNVNKGDVLVASDTPGYAMVGSMAHTLSPLQIVGRAITSKLDAGNGVVEIIV